MIDDRDPTLSVAFMRSHPAQAARVLDVLPAAQAAALFARVPARLAAGVLAAMLPLRAARCVEALDDERALEVLAPMATPAAVAVLRHLPPMRQQALVAALPTTVSIASSLLLGYGEDTLGAWADPDVVVLGAEVRCAAALDQLRRAESTLPVVYVTDANRRLAGSVTLTALLRAPDAATLATVMLKEVDGLPAQTPLAAAPDHPGWARASILPVVEPDNRLIGALSHDALIRAVQRQNQRGVAPDAPLPASLPFVLVNSYWQTLSGAIEATLGLLPRVPPVLLEVDEDGDGG